MKRSSLLSRVFAPALCAVAFLTISSTVQAASLGNVSPTKGNASTDFIPGTGVPENQFTIDTAITGESTAIKARDRVSGNPISVSGNRYQVPAGLVSAGTRTAWNFDFQFKPKAGAVPTDYIYEVMADIDPGYGVTNFVTIAVPNSVQAVPVGDSYYPNGTGGSISSGPVYSYNGTWSDATTFVIANSQNYSFGHWAGPTFTNSDPGEYELRLVMRDAANPSNIVSSVTAFAVVPEPASIALLGVAGLSLIRRGRRS